jgi:hypothetical protein
MDGFLETEDHERISVGAGPGVAFAACIATLKSLGKVKDNEIQQEPRQVTGRIRMRGLAFARATVTVESADGDSSSVVDVTGACQESVPPRHYARKAVARFMQALEVA